MAADCECFKFIRERKSQMDKEGKPHPCSLVQEGSGMDRDSHVHDPWWNPACSDLVNSFVSYLTGPLFSLTHV